VLDAAQVAAHAMPALAALGCDFMALSRATRCTGPMGIGVLAGRREALERLAPLRLGGDMVEHGSASTTCAGRRCRRAWKAARPTWPAPSGWRRRRVSIEAFGRAAIDAHVAALRAQAAAGLAALDGVRVLSKAAAAIVSFVAEGASARHRHAARRRGIAVRTGTTARSRCSITWACGPTTRASFALYNTADDEVERWWPAVAQALELLR
jgi:cysteine desulfurase/selenocysteine lyase